MRFGMSKFSQWTSQFVPKRFARYISHGFNRVVSKVVPQQKDDLLDSSREPIYQVVMLATPEESQEVEKEFPGLKFTRSSPYAADIINGNASKLQGIELVGKEYGFDINQVMAFGDSDNDLEMLSGVGMSIAMGRSKQLPSIQQPVIVKTVSIKP